MKQLLNINSSIKQLRLPAMTPNKLSNETDEMLELAKQLQLKRSIQEIQCHDDNIREPVRSYSDHKSLYNLFLSF